MSNEANDKDLIAKLDELALEMGKQPDIDAMNPGVGRETAETVVALPNPFYMPEGGPSHVLGVAPVRRRERASPEAPLLHVRV